MSNLPGFGDEATWPPYLGDPMDPRHPGDDDEDGPYPPDVNEESAWIMFCHSDKSTAADRLRSLIAECKRWGSKESLRVAEEAEEYLAEIEEDL